MSHSIGWQHQAPPNIVTPCVSVLRVNAKPHLLINVILTEESPLHKRPVSGKCFHLLTSSYILHQFIDYFSTCNSAVRIVPSNVNKRKPWLFVIAGCVFWFDHNNRIRISLVGRREICKFLFKPNFFEIWPFELRRPYLCVLYSLECVTWRHSTSVHPSYDSLSNSFFKFTSRKLFCIIDPFSGSPPMIAGLFALIPQWRQIFHVLFFLLEIVCSWLNTYFQSSKTFKTTSYEFNSNIFSETSDCVFIFKVSL